jgi:hypothetical protein
MQLAAAVLAAQLEAVRHQQLLHQATSQQPVAQVARLVGVQAEHHLGVLAAMEHCLMAHTGPVAAVGEMLSLGERAVLPAIAVRALGAQPPQQAIRPHQQGQTVAS